MIPFVKEALSFILLRPLVSYIRPKSFYEMWRSFWFDGAATGRSQQVYLESLHHELQGLSMTIPTVGPGDYVAWHPDLVHAVEPSHNGEKESVVMYIPASPVCHSNARYMKTYKTRFENGDTPPDYPVLNLERTFQGRSGKEHLSELGLAQTAFTPTAAYCSGTDWSCGAIPLTPEARELLSECDNISGASYSS